MGIRRRLTAIRAVARTKSHGRACTDGHTVIVMHGRAYCNGQTLPRINSIVRSTWCGRTTFSLSAAALRRSRGTPFPCTSALRIGSECITLADGRTMICGGPSSGRGMDLDAGAGRGAPISF
eukprot:g16042.t1